MLNWHLKAEIQQKTHDLKNKITGTPSTHDMNTQGPTPQRDRKEVKLIKNGVNILHSISQQPFQLSIDAVFDQHGDNVHAPTKTKQGSNKSNAGVLNLVHKQFWQQFQDLIIHTGKEGVGYSREPQML